MRNVEIIVMGKTGAGKSTLINAVLEEDLAPTGIGQPITKKNEVYSRKMLLPVGSKGNNQYGQIGCNLNMYDTVGLEIDSTITDRTLDEIKAHIQKTKSEIDSSDIHLVWFCVNDRSNRFEDYEVELIRKLSIDYEIPFIIVLTQCFSGEEEQLEEKIRNAIPEVVRRRVLAKDYLVRGGKITAYGITDLLRTSIVNYSMLKADILEKKLDLLEENSISRIQYIEERGKEIVSDYVLKAEKIGFIPGGCIPAVHGMCIKMIADLNDLAGFKSVEYFADEIFEDVVLGLIVTPLMLIPLLSAAAASAYVEQIGEDYMKALLNIIDLSSDSELNDNALMKERLKKELSKMKKQQEKKAMSNVTKEQKILIQQVESEKDLDDLSKVNIMVVGRAGEGKSTLINAVFGEEMVGTGNGRPVTKQIFEHQNENIPIRIWETSGLELYSEEVSESIKAIESAIVSKASSDNLYERIHIVWYCISSGRRQYRNVEIEFIRELHSIGVPLIIVLTQCLYYEEVNIFEAEIEKINNSMGIDDIRIVQVLAMPVELRGMSTPIPAFGLDNLVNVTLEMLPPLIKSGFIAAQKVNQRGKKRAIEKELSKMKK